MPRSSPSTWATSLAIGSGNDRNGTNSKTVLADIGAIDLDIARDRAATFDPKLVPKHARRLEGFNQNIVRLYARGLSTRDIRRELTWMSASRCPRR